jgi:hypothetical protein
MAVILDRVRAAVDRRCVAGIFVRCHVRLRTTALELHRPTPG